LPGECQEGGLEGVLGVLLVAKDAAADVQDHRPVPPHEGSKGSIIALSGETLQELRIRRLGGTLCPGQPPDVLKDKARLCVGHGLGSPQGTRFVR
jgi:hypothetical protein